MAINHNLMSELRNACKSGSKVLFPDDKGFAESLKRWADNAERPAGAVVLATAVEDIQATIRFAGQNNIDLAIRSGGHSAAGSSSSSDGIVIDLSLMKNVTVDTVRQTVTVQTGCIWADIEPVIAEHDLAIVAGTVNHTGCGGVLMGGGYGWLSSRYGLAIDNLLSAKLVLADGNLVTASPTSHPDLFWAIRGAGANFGCAVEFTIQAHPQPNTVFAGLLAFPPPCLAKAVEIVNTIPTRDTSVYLGFSAPPPMNQPMVLCALYHNGDEATAREIFAPLFALGPVMDTTAQIPHHHANSMMNFAATHGGRKTVKGASFSLPLSPQFVQTAFDAFAAFAAQYPDAGCSIALMEMTDHSQINKVAPTATAFANRGPHNNVMIAAKWKDPANDAACRQWVRVMGGLFQAEKTRKMLAGEKQSGVGMYSNYSETYATPEQIFGENYQRLRELKARYDPECLFNKWHPIVPAVRN